MNNPLVSVIIPTYKRSESLPRAIRSVINQTYEPIEIIIVDDNDGNNEFRISTKSIVEKEFKTQNIIYLEHEKNKGLPAARNTGIRISKGKYIAFLDDDDEWLPQKIEKQVALFRKLPDDVGVVGCGWNLIDSVYHYREEKRPNHKGDLRKILALNHFSPPSMVIIKKIYLEKVNGFDESYKSKEDIELYYRLSFYCKFDYVPEYLANYYYHPQSMSRNFKQKLEATEQFVKQHKNTLRENYLPWSQIHERKGELAASCGELGKAVKAFITAYRFNPGRIQILAKLLLSFLGAKRYVKIRKL